VNVLLLVVAAAAIEAGAAAELIDLLLKSGK
jgi:hypothetical protein